MKTVALLTGRGNNTLPDKNVIEVLGKPVLFYPAHAAKMAKEVDLYFCSSDDEKILNAAEKEGYARIARPPELSTPSAQHVDCIMHGLSHIFNNGVEADICVVLLANNVTIKSEWIDECVQIMKSDSSVTAVVPVYEDNDHHPLRGKRIAADGTLSMYLDNVTGKVSTNRQDLPPCYYLSHNFWVLNVKYLLSGESGQPPWSFMGNRIMPYVVDTSIDIHHEIDLILAREWIRENYED